MEFTFNRIDILPSVLATQNIINLLPRQLHPRRIIFIRNGESVSAGLAGEGVCGGGGGTGGLVVDEEEAAAEGAEQEHRGW